MLSVEGLNQAYGESQILWDMKLDVPEGSCTCLMGRNGVGKTTFLRAIMGTLRTRSGKVNFRRGGAFGATPGAPRAARYRLRAAGSRDFSAAQRARKSRAWRGCRTGESASFPSAC